MPSNVDKKQRSTRPVAPENSALADELRSQLKGKPTKCGFNRSLTHEIVSFVGDILKIGIVAVLCLFCRLRFHHQAAFHRRPHISRRITDFIRI